MATRMRGTHETNILAADPSDPFTSLFSATMAGGTWLVSSVPMMERGALDELAGYVTVPVDVILQYERTILELRREVLHYKDLLSRSIHPEPYEELGEPEPNPRANSASTRILNSILEARIPKSAAFAEFEDGEL
jgi:hypothetical protein